MGKFFVRVTIMLVAIYFLLCYTVAQFWGFDILDYSYTILFEIITTIYCFSEGKYHCRYIKFTMLGILACDSVTHLDYAFNLLSETGHNVIPSTLLILGVTTTCVLAIRHFYQVNRLKRLKNGRKQTIAN